MTIQEFKAWLEGFSEVIDEAPTPEQWAKIKAKVEKLESFRSSDVLPRSYPSGIAPLKIGDAVAYSSEVGATN